MTSDRSGKLQSTNRSELLLKVLNCINRDDYNDFEKYLIFGGSLDDLLWDADHPGQREEEDHATPSAELTDAIGKAVADITTHRGRRHVRRRITLGAAPDTSAVRSLDHLKNLAPNIADILKGALDAPQTPEGITASEAPNHELDELDAAFAAEVLGRLPKIVDRAARLDEVTLEEAPSDVQAYFEEAHRCYLYGFRVACAVLCRAILAAALENLCDPRGTVQKRVAPGHSYFEALVKKATNEGRLTDDRPEWAIKIRDAGNNAVHNYLKFSRRWGDSVDEILLNTRKVLLDLYARPGQQAARSG